MFASTVLTLVLFGQVGKVETPTMQFTNVTGTSITVWVYCRGHGLWANNRQPLVIRPRASATLKLHEGYFHVLVQNKFGQEDRNERVLVAQELDHMDIVGIYSGNEGGIKVTDHHEDNDENLE